MSLTVPTAVLDAAERGPIDDAVFLDVIRTSLPYAWDVVAAAAADQAPGRPFGEHDLAFIRRIAPHIAGALRRAALVDAAQVARLEDLADATRRSKPIPGVAVIDDRWRITQWTAAAEAQLADLADGGAATSAIINLVARQRTSGGATGVALLTVRGRSGRWYTLRAALAEPDELGRSSTVLIITPPAQRLGAASLTRRGERVLNANSRFD